MPLTFCYANSGATATLCGKPVPTATYTNDPGVPVGCSACLIRIARGDDAGYAAIEKANLLYEHGFGDREHSFEDYLALTAALEDGDGRAAHQAMLKLVGINDCDCAGCVEVLDAG